MTTIHTFNGSQNISI